MVGGFLQSTRQKVSLLKGGEKLLQVALKLSSGLRGCQDSIPQIQPRQAVHPLHANIFDLVQDRAQGSFSNDKAACCLPISGSEGFSRFSEGCLEGRST